MKRISTCGREAAEAIQRRETFSTHGNLRGEAVTGLSRSDAGRLAGEYLDTFGEDSHTIVYVVWSYGTPIAWETADGSVHIVKQHFSRTTTAHQGRLYLLESAS